jgi:hypothetical protein
MPAFVIASRGNREAIGRRRSNPVFASMEENWIASSYGFSKARNAYFSQ